MRIIQIQFATYFSINLIYRYYARMNEEQIQPELQTLSLEQLLTKDQFVLEELFSIKGIHVKIKSDLYRFVLYCKNKQQFTDRLISLGIKCPMHQSSNQSMRNISFICADLLTCDHESIADLFIGLQHQNEQSSKSQQITQSSIDGSIAQIDETMKIDYRYLQLLLDYINQQEIDQNCLNYIGKVINTLITKRFTFLLHFFKSNLDIFQNLVSLAYYPSIGQIFYKILTTDQKFTITIEQFIKITISSLLNKIHKNIDKYQTCIFYQTIYEILKNGSYSDKQDKINLQKCSNIIVSSQEVNFHVEGLFQNLTLINKNQKSLICLKNSLQYLLLIINRMNYDEINEMTGQPQKYRATFDYQTDLLFSSFCRILNLYNGLLQYSKTDYLYFRLLPLRFMELLYNMSRHFVFGSFYHKINKAERIQSFNILIRSVCEQPSSGLILLNITWILQKILIEQLKIENLQLIIVPQQIYQIVAINQQKIANTVNNIFCESTHERNRDLKGAHLRKMLMLCESYIKNEKWQKMRLTQISLQKIFPSFNIDNCKRYDNYVSLGDHPAGSRAKVANEFIFIFKNKEVQSPSVLSQKPKQLSNKVLLNMESKIQTLKDRVKQKNQQKQLINNISQIKPKQRDQEKQSMGFQNGSEPKQSDKKLLLQKQIAISKNIKSKHSQNQGIQQFYVKHLLIY